MASIDKRPGGGYRARWREYPGGPQETRQFARKGDAERFLDAVRGDLARGVYIDPAGGRTLFRDYAESWRVAQMHRPSTAAQAESYLRLHAYPTLGRRPLGAIRGSEIQGWVKAISSTLAPGSVEVTYRWVASIFKAAVADRLIAASPCVRIALPKRTDTEVVPLGVGQVVDLTAAAPRWTRRWPAWPAWPAPPDLAHTSPTRRPACPRGDCGGVRRPRHPQVPRPRPSPHAGRANDRSTTLLGSWYATVLFWRPQVALAVSDASLAHITPTRRS